MKNLIHLFIQVFIVFSLLIFSSCGAGLSNCTSEDLGIRSDAFLNAAAVYSQDPSTENCKAYKKALEDYIDIVKDCSLVGRDAKKEAEDAIDELDC